MPRLNQNQRIQTLTMLARGDNVSNLSRAFGCASLSSKQVGWQIAVDPVTEGYKPSNGQVHYAGAPSTSFFERRQVLQGSTVSVNSVVSPQASPATHSAKEALCRTSAYSTSSGCPFAVGTTAFPLGATAMGSDYSVMSLGLTLVIMAVEFEFLRRGERFADNCLIERGRFGGGIVMVWGDIMGRRKTNFIVVQGNLNAQGYIN